MSPVVKRKGERFTLPSKYLLFILTILCTVMMLVTFGTNVFNRPFNRVVGYVIVPFEQGIAKAGEWLSNRSDELVQIRTTFSGEQCRGWAGEENWKFLSYLHPGYIVFLIRCFRGCFPKFSCLYVLFIFFPP